MKNFTDLYERLSNILEKKRSMGGLCIFGLPQKAFDVVPLKFDNEAEFLG